MRIKEKFTCKLLVEGNDDQHVIWALCQHNKITENFDVIDCEGVDSLFQQIPVRLKQSGIKTIGIVLDADNDLAQRWAAIRDILRAGGITCPDELPPNGLIFDNSKIKVGIWIMPDNNLNGMLEDFIAFLIPDDDELFPAVSESLTSFEEKSLSKYAKIHRSKALIHCWLSLQESPGTPMGLAITKRYLNIERATAKIFNDWLVTLFAE